MSILASGACRSRSQTYRREGELMAELEKVDDDGEVRCSKCGVVFFLTWHRNPAYIAVEYCPFCGAEFDD